MGDGPPSIVAWLRFISPITDAVSVLKQAARTIVARRLFDAHAARRHPVPEAIGTLAITFRTPKGDRRAPFACGPNHQIAAAIVALVTRTRRHSGAKISAVSHVKTLAESEEFAMVKLRYYVASTPSGVRASPGLSAYVTGNGDGL